jgi:hypothetical protein
MKQILLSTLTIAAILISVTGASKALFTGTASNNGNTFGAGTLVLTINGAPGTASTPVFTITNAAPGDTYNQILSLQNTGSIAASTLLLTSVVVTDSKPDTSANLGNVLTTYIWEDTNENNMIDAGEPTWVNGVHLTSIPANLNLGALGVGAGSTRHFKVKLVFDTGAGNEYQGESISFNFNFQANQ